MEKGDAERSFCYTRCLIDIKRCDLVTLSHWRLDPRKGRCDMATPIAATPILEGKNAEEFWKVHDDDTVRFPLTPIPKIEEIKEKMLADDRDSEK